MPAFLITEFFKDLQLQEKFNSPMSHSPQFGAEIQ
jgi:hypothetical protein